MQTKNELNSSEDEMSREREREGERLWIPTGQLETGWKRIKSRVFYPK